MKIYLLFYRNTLGLTTVSKSKVLKHISERHSDYSQMVTIQTFDTELDEIVKVDDAYSFFE